MIKPSHYRTPRELPDACFLDCRYVYRSPIEHRIEAGLNVLAAVGLGVVGAVVLFYWLSW